MPRTADLLDKTLAAAKQDPQFVTPEGVPLRRLTHGVEIRDLPTHVDERGSGASDVLAVNFPTIAYDHARPDKYRLPIDTDLIPHRFADGVRER
jgi:hypothetical protein